MNYIPIVSFFTMTHFSYLYKLEHFMYDVVKGLY